MKFLSRHAVTILVLVSFMTTFSICQAKEYMLREAFDEDPWNYIKQEFGTKVDDCSHKYLQKVFKYPFVIAGVGAGSFLGIAESSLFMFGWKSRTFFNFLPSPLDGFFSCFAVSIGPVGGFVGSQKIVEWIETYIDDSVAFSVLKEFLNQWPDNKPYTPEELHATFEKLREKYKTKGDEWLRKVSYAVVKDIRNKHILA